MKMHMRTKGLATGELLRFVSMIRTTFVILVAVICAVIANPLDEPSDGEPRGDELRETASKEVRA
jgi:hypothetical protein